MSWEGETGECDRPREVGPRSEGAPLGRPKAGRDMMLQWMKARASKKENKQRRDAATEEHRQVVMEERLCFLLRAAEGGAVSVRVCLSVYLLWWLASGWLAGWLAREEKVRRLTKSAEVWRLFINSSMHQCIITGLPQ